MKGTLGEGVWSCRVVGYGGKIDYGVFPTISGHCEYLTDSVSAAQVVISTPRRFDNSFRPEAYALGRAGAQAAELHLFRNGKLQWVGTIHDVRLGAVTAQITAADLAVWLNWRFVHVTDHLSGLPLTLAVVVATEALPAELKIEYVIENSGMAAVAERDRDAAAHEPAATLFTELTKTGGHWTMRGRSMRLWSSASPVAIATLADRDFDADMTVFMNTGDMVQRAVVHGADNPSNIPTAVGAPLPVPVRGEAQILVEGVGVREKRYNETTILDIDSAIRYAQRRVAFGTLNWHLEVPSGARIQPSAGVVFDDLFPGQQIEVGFNRVPITGGVREKLVVQTVSVDWDQTGEKVGVTLVPVLDMDGL